MAGKQDVSLTEEGWWETGKKHSGTGQRDSFHGILFQLKLLLLTWFRSWQENVPFQLATEWELAGVFDDLILRRQPRQGPDNKHELLLVQMKHSRNKDEITFKDLNADPKNKRFDDFSLGKYFQAYQKVKEKSEFAAYKVHFVLYTNVKLNVDNLESNDVRLEKCEDLEWMYTGKGEKYRIVPGEKLVKVEENLVDLRTRFFEDLIFVVQCPGEGEIGEEIEKQLGVRFPTVESDIVAATFFKRTADWIAPKKGTFLDREHVAKSLRNVELQFYFIFARQLTEATLASLPNLVFTDDSKERMARLVEDEAIDEHVMITTQPTLTAAKVGQVLLKTDLPHVLLSGDNIIETGIQNNIKAAFEFTKCKILVLIVDNNSTDFKIFRNNLRRVLESKKFELTLNENGSGDIKLQSERVASVIEGLRRENHVVELVNGVLKVQKLSQDLKRDLKRLLWCKLILIMKGDEEDFKMTDIVVESQEEVMKKSILFQGMEMNLGDIVKNDMVDGTTVTELMAGKKITIHTTEEAEDMLYIERKFVLPAVQIDVKIFKSSKEEIRGIMAISGEKDQVSRMIGTNVVTFETTYALTPPLHQGVNVVLEKDEEFLKLCERFPEENVHWLFFRGDKLYWRESRGSVSALVPHKLFNEEEAACFDELELLEYNHCVVIIADDSGTGKSKALKRLQSLARGTQRWVLRFELNDHTEDLTNEKPGDRCWAVTLLKKLAGIRTKLEERLFDRFCEEGKTLVMLDGFDEVDSGIGDLIVEWIFAMRGIGKVFITTRSNMQPALEEALGVFAVVLNKFTRDQQLTFLHDFWGGDTEKAEILVNRLETTLSETLKLLGVPLMLRILAELYADSPIDSEAKSFRLVQLFDKILTRQFERYHKEKTFMWVTPNKGVKRAIMLDLVDFEGMNECLALVLLLGEDYSKVCPGEEEAVTKWLEAAGSGEENRGVLQGVRHGKPRFLHRSFPEFLVARFFNTGKAPEYFVSKILLQTKYNGVRLFINDYLIDFNSIPTNRLDDYGNRLVAIWNQRSDVNDETASFPLARGRPYKKLPTIQSLRKASKRRLIDDSHISQSHIWVAWKEGRVNIIKYCHACTETKGDAFQKQLRLESCLKYTVLTEVLYNDYYRKENNFHNILKLATEETLGLVGESLLSEASRFGMQNNVKLLLDKAVPVHVEALHLALMTPHHDVVEYLVNSNVHFKEDTLTRAASGLKSGRLDTVKLLVSRGAKVNPKLSRTDHSPIAVAAMSGDLLLVEYLLENGADPNLDKEVTPLALVVKTKNLQMVKTMLAYKANPNPKVDFKKSPLYFAVYHESLEILDALIDAGATTDWMKLIKTSAKLGRFTILQRLIKLVPTQKSGTYRDILRQGIKSDNLDLIDFLQAFDGEMNKDELLSLAAQSGSLQYAMRLVSDGADVNKKRKEKWEDKTPLHYACKASRVDMVYYLVGVGAVAPNVEIPGRNHQTGKLLSLVRTQSPEDVLKFLFSNSVFENELLQAVVQAVHQNKRAIVKYLLTHGFPRRKKYKS